MKPQSIFTACLAALALAAMASPACADSLSLNLQQSIQTVLQGTASIGFYGTITNPSATDTVYLNGDSYTSSSSYLTIDDSYFFNNAPFSLAPGASSGQFEIFAVDLLPNTPVGDYPLNSFTILGGPDGGMFSDFNSLASVNFEVDVQAPVSTTPEPATWALLGSGLALWAGLVETRRRRRRRS